jgi:outer membrane protein assembly factor BamB
VKLATGKAVWEVNTADEFEPAEAPKWGTCSTPLLAGGRLIVNPGAKDASLAALDAKTGKIVWSSPGRPAGYGSFVLATFAGKEQIIGHDAISLGGWEPETGKRLWQLVPERSGDFNVPTPIPVGDHLLVATENNGTRLLAFDSSGRIDPKPLAVNRRLAPDTHTPVAANGRVFGLWRRLFCLDLSDGLKAVWDSDDPAFTGYGSVVTDGKRVLVVSERGEFVLFDAGAKEFEPLGRMMVLDGEKGMYAHPAFVGSKAFVRGASSVVRVDLGKN